MLLKLDHNVTHPPPNYQTRDYLLVQHLGSYDVAEMDVILLPVAKSHH